MLKSIQNNLNKYMHKDYAYIVTCVIYLISIYLFIGFFAVKLDFVSFFIVSIISFEQIRRYSGGFHILNNNIGCAVFTVFILKIFSFIAENTVDILHIVFFIFLICCRNLYNKIPIGFEDIAVEYRWYNCKPFDKIKYINREKLNSIKYNCMWYRKRALAFLSLNIFISFILFLINKDLICCYFLWSVIMTDILCFRNIN